MGPGYNLIPSLGVTPTRRLWQNYSRSMTSLQLYGVTLRKTKMANFNTKRIAVSPEGKQELYERNKYSAAVKSGGFLFVSGQVGNRADGSAEPDPEKQLRLAFTNLNSVLVAAGCSFDDVVDFTAFLVDPEKLTSIFFKVKDEFWGALPYPPLTAVGVTWLYGFDFELKVTARLPEA